MERRKALALAGVAALTLTAGTAAAANVGLLGASGTDDGLGELDAQSVAQLVDTPATTTATAPATPDSTVVYVDEYVTAPTAAGGATASAGSGSTGDTGSPAAAPAPAAPPTAAAPTPAPMTSGSSDPAVVAPYQDDDEYEHEDEVEHEDHDEVEHEVEVEDHDDD